MILRRQRGRLPGSYNFTTVTYPEPIQPGLRIHSRFLWAHFNTEFRLHLGLGSDIFQQKCCSGLVCHRCALRGPHSL